MLNVLTVVKILVLSIKLDMKKLINHYINAANVESWLKKIVLFAINYFQQLTTVKLVNLHAK